MRRGFKKFIFISGIISGILILITGFIIFRTPNISNLLKKAILPRIESATGYNTMADKMYINLFPLYLGVRDLRLIDSEGNAILSAKRIKLYPCIAGIIKKRIDIKKIYFNKLTINLDEEKLERLRERFSQEGNRPSSLTIRQVEISDGSLSLTLKNTDIDARGIRIILRDSNVMKVDIERFIIDRMEDIPLTVSAKMILPMKDKKKEIRIIGLNVISDSSDIYINGRIIPLKDGEFNQFILDLKSSGTIRLEKLMAMLKVKEELFGKVAFDLRINGNTLDPSISGNGILNNGNLYGVEVNRLRTEIFYKTHNLIFRDADALLYGGRAKAEAHLRIPVDEFSLDIRCDDINSRSLLKLIRLDLELPDGKVMGELYHRGKRFSPEGWFIYSNTDKIKDKKEDGFSKKILSSIDKITGAFNLDGETHKLTLDKILIEGGSSSVKGSGSINTELKTVDMIYHLSTDDISSILPDGIDIHGKGTINGRVRGNIKRPDIISDIVLRDPEFYGYRLRSLDAKLRMEDSTEDRVILFVEKFILSQDIEEHKIKGKIYFPIEGNIMVLGKPYFDLHINSENIDPVKIYTEIGKFLRNDHPLINMDASIKGDKDAMRIEVYLTDIALKSQEKERTKKGLMSDLHAYINIFNLKNYDLQGHGFLRLIDTGIDTGMVDGNLNIDFKGHGDIKKPLLNIKIRSDDILFHKVSTGSSRFDIILTKEDLNITGFLMKERVSVRGNISLLEKDSLIDITMKNGEYTSIIRAFVRDLPEEIRFKMEGGLRFTGKIRAINGSLEINNFILTLYEHELRNDQPISINIKNNLITVERFHLINEGGELSIDGRLMPSAWYELRAKGNTYLFPFKRFFKSIKTIKGMVDFNLNMRGKWDEPVFTGSLLLRSGTVGIENIPYDLMDVNASIKFDGSRLFIESMNGKVMGGRITAKGTAYLKGFHLGRFYIETTLMDLKGYIMKDLYAEFDSKVYFRGINRLNTITGEVLLKRADYRRYIEWKTYLMKSIKRETPTIPPNVPSYMNAELNIKIKGPSKDGEITVDNNIARLSIKADLLLRGNLQKPVILGRIESLSGTVYFRNNELRLVNASLDFTDPVRIDPYFQIKAETEARGYRVYLFVDGHLERFNLTLSSEPPLDEVDIIALLTLGETGTALKGYGGGIGAMEATSFITGQLQDTLEERAKRFTGIDRILISPYISRTGEVAPRITLSKKISDKLSILYTTTAGTSEEQVIKLEYMLNRNISLIGQRDERGSLGSDLRFRFEFR